MDLYGEGLERIVRALDEAGPEAAALRAAIVDDGVVASLLLIHGLYPVDLETRVQEALDGVRPYMHSHGGDVELLSLEDGVARLRLEGSCQGCPASAATLEQAIRQALEEAAPDLAGHRGGGDRGPGPGTGGVTPEAGQRAELVTALRRLRRAGAPAPARRRPRPPSAASCAGTRSPRPTATCCTSGAADRVRLPDLLALRSGDAEFRPTGARTPGLEDLVDARRRLGALLDPDRPRVLHAQHHRERGRRDVPEPGRAHRVRARPRRLGRPRRRSTRCWPTLEPDAEGLIVNRLARPHQHVLAPIDACYGLVGVGEGVVGGHLRRRASSTDAVAAYFAEPAAGGRGA